MVKTMPFNRTRTKKQPINATLICVRMEFGTNLTLHSENIARAIKLLRNYFPRDCAKLSQSIARNISWGVVFGAIAQFCCCSLLSYCSCGMLPKIDLRNGHFLQRFRNTMHNNPGFCSIFGSICTKKPSTCILYANMDTLEVAASVGSEAQDLVHGSGGPLSPLLSLASVYIFRPRFVIQALLLRFWNWE